MFIGGLVRILDATDGNFIVLKVIKQARFIAVYQSHCIRGRRTVFSRTPEVRAVTIIVKTAMGTIANRQGRERISVRAILLKEPTCSSSKFFASRRYTTDNFDKDVPFIFAGQVPVTRANAAYWVCW